MYDTIQVLKNVQSLYENTGQLKILTDFERVFDRLDLYLYENWKQGELIQGPIVERHRVTCAFMWKMNEMPNPQGGTRLIENGCNVLYKKDKLLEPRKIESYADYRPGTKKPKFDPTPIWIVEVIMPKPVLRSFGQGKEDVMEDQAFLDTSIEKGDLRDYVGNTFGVDRYKSKMGEDKDVIVLDFDTKYVDVAKDLENFIERGYNEVLDADSVSASNTTGNYKVFAEFPRTRKSVQEIDNLISELKLLTLKENFQFKFYKDNARYDYDVNTLQNVMAVSPLQYTNEVV
jgi:hypothetical protein